MASNLGIIGVGIMIIEIPGYNLSKNLVPFLHDDVTSPPTWIDVKYSFKGLKDGFMEMLNENRKAMAGNLHNN